MNAVTSGLYGVFQYQLDTESRTFELDGQRTLSVSNNLATREAVLYSVLENSNTGFFVPGLGYVGSTIASIKIAKVLCQWSGPLFSGLRYLGVDTPSIFEGFSDNHPRVFEAVQTVSSFLNECYDKSQLYVDTFLNDWADKVFNTVALVSYVALIALGNPIAGGMGLLSLTFIALKRSGYLPAFLESPLSYLQFVGYVYSVLFTPRFFLIKAFEVFNLALTLISYTAKNNTFQSFIASYFGDFTERQHHISEETSLSRFLAENGITPDNVTNFSELSGSLALVSDNEDISTINLSTDHYRSTSKLAEFCKENDNFTVNLSSVHAFSWGEPRTPEEMAAFAALDPREQIDRLEQDGLSLGIKIHPAPEICERLSQREQSIVTGWKRLSGFFRSNTLPDQIPANLHEFEAIIKMVMRSIEETVDQNEKKRKIEDLLVCCSGCVLAWTRDIEELMLPQSTDPAWRIHRELAKYRSELVSDLFVLGNQYFPGLFRQMGGVGNTHTHALANASLWHEWKSFRGELFMQTHGRDLWVRYWQSAPITEDSSEADRNGIVGFMSRAFDSLFSCGRVGPTEEYHRFKLLVSSAMLSLEYEVGYFGPFLHTLGLPVLFGQYGVVKNIAGAIENQIQMDQIPQSVLQTWFGQMEEKGVSLLSEFSDSGYDERFVKMVAHPYREGKNTLSLTPAGINLLLWDLGIIERRSESDRYQQSHRTQKSSGDYLSDSNDPMLREIAPYASHLDDWCCLSDEEMLENMVQATNQNDLVERSLIDWLDYMKDKGLLPRSTDPDTRYNEAYVTVGMSDTRTRYSLTLEGARLFKSWYQERLAEEKDVGDLEDGFFRWFFNMRKNT